MFVLNFVPLAHDSIADYQTDRSLFVPVLGSMGAVALLVFTNLYSYRCISRISICKGAFSSVLLLFRGEIRG